MPETISKPKSKQIYGIGGQFTHRGDIRADEFLSQLKGRKAIQKFREMRDNDATIGAVMYATEQVLRDVDYKVVPANDSDQAKKEAEFVKSVLLDMEHTLDDHISEAISFLSYGFSDFEVVYKRRVGPNEIDPKKFSKFTDGRMGVRKLASRAQWTIREFVVDKQSGDFLGVHQDRNALGKPTFIPASKLLHYKTTTTNNDPSGRSVLRNAYKSYTYLTNLQEIEAIAIERELCGIPVGYMPSEYLSPSATDDQIAVREMLETALRDVKYNDQGFIILPSDLQSDNEGKLSNERYVDVKLMSSDGNRNIDIGPVVSRYQHDIARSIMAEFMMLGSNSTGSYALSKSKTDLFLRSMESYINTIFDVLNKQLLEPLWRLNGLDFDLMPVLKAGDVAPHELSELGSYLRNLNGADINLRDQTDVVENLLDIAEIEGFDRDRYEKSLEEDKAAEKAKNDSIVAKNKQPNQGSPSGKVQKPS